MIKDKVIKMDNGKSYYILEETVFENKKYILTLECDLEHDTADEENYYVMELVLDGSELSIKPIEDNNLADIVTKLLLEKAKI